MDNNTNAQETQQVRYSKLYYFPHRAMRLSETQLANASSESGLDAATLERAYSALEKCIDPETRLAADAIVAEGFVDFISAEHNGEHGPYSYIDIAVTMDDRTVTARFGEKFVKQNHKVTFTIAYSGDKLETIKKVGIEKGDKVQFAACNLGVKDNTSADGRVFLKITGYSVGGLSLVAKSKLNSENGQSASAYGSAAYAAPAAPAPVPAAAPQPAKSSGQKCSNPSCNYTVSEQEKSFCLNNAARFGGRVYCRKCQQALFPYNASQPAAPAAAPVQQQAAPAQAGYNPPQFQDFSVAGIDDGECPF